MEWDEETSCRKNVKNALRIKNRLVREGLAEFLGTFILIVSCIKTYFKEAQSYLLKLMLATSTPNVSLIKQKRK